MDILNEIAHISGKSGLFKVLKPTRTGVIVETLDALKQKSVVSGQTRISVLKDISLYLDDHQDSTLPSNYIARWKVWYPIMMRIAYLPLILRKF
jgi:hypothetical protein